MIKNKTLDEGSIVSPFKVRELYKKKKQTRGSTGPKRDVESGHESDYVESTDQPSELFIQDRLKVIPTNLSFNADSSARKIYNEKKLPDKT